ncbi:phosphate/phosphite/phosphonate ABC transporter substrate-binding protein [Epidermidibacterium keratini]|uniref:Phosphate/phosphite/phosphonate ABC transporter substrate-binding protein n=1 Tax=Epidermidibacterium keratini TaxID=1891644 RepID=A0A7L4YT02_9ACTN|nr:phosphate/phosphite/phosphonate ABC transporter substrate-binding protein [Epidermidibacterium keratini]QHC02182.1 phosphate/phosphite/phosphonate ABC transporter substrate-binding protein [Epidermidibacterium keratini]
MRTRLFSSLAASAAALILLAGCGSSADSSSSGGAAADSDPDTLVFASIPSENATSLEQQYANVIKVIEEETGKQVEVQNATDYAAVIEGLRAGKVQIAGLGPFSYITAKDSDVAIEPVAAVVDSPDEEPGYKSYGIVPADSDITDISGFKDKNVCFVDPTSTSGYLYPTAGLEDAGIDPESDITPVMAGGHDASALAVASGQCDAGFAFDAMVEETLIKSGQLSEGQLKVVWESEIIPGSPVAISTDTMTQETQDKIKAAFTEKINVDALVQDGVCTDAASCVLPEESKWGYTAVDDQLYDGVRKVCEITKAEACTAS